MPCPPPHFDQYVAIAFVHVASGESLTYFSEAAGISVAIFSVSHLIDNGLAMVTGLAVELADKLANGRRNEQGQQQAIPAATARGLTPPARLFSFVLCVIPFIRLVAA